MRTNATMLSAQKNQMDEFYTKYDTISDEIIHYRNFLRGKRVYCNCDNPDHSNFWKYLKDHFIEFGLLSLTATFYGKDAAKTVVKLQNGKLVQRTTKLKENGDYRSDECLKILSACDVVITNPPFSLTKYFIPLMYEYNKDFIILGNQNIMTFKDVYPHILDHTLHLGISIHSGDVEFEIPKEYELVGNARADDGKQYARVTGIRWFTSFDHGQYADCLVLQSAEWNLKNHNALRKTFCQKYGKIYYPVYDNYPAIEVPYTAAIPSDYSGVVGVPITFLDKYNPKQFDLVGFRKGLDGKDLRINGKEPYFRFLVQMKQGVSFV